MELKGEITNEQKKEAKEATLRSMEEMKQISKYPSEGMPSTKEPEEIMNLLWEVGEPLASSEIVSKSVNRTWRKSYINLLINSLLNKQMIEVVGVKQMTKNYLKLSRNTILINLM